MRWVLADKRFLYIIGSPRSGTTWLQTMIAAHPLVCTTVELTLFTRYTAPWIQAWKDESANIKKSGLYQGIPFLWSEDEFYSFLREFLEKVYAKVIDTKPQATHILDKHPGYSKYVEDIHELIPGARFIHVIRDGRDVAASMIAARRDMGFGADTVEGSAKEWKECVKAAQQARNYTGQYLEVRYEELLHDGGESLARVFDFCGLNIGSQQAAQILSEHHFEKMQARSLAPVNGVKVPKAHFRRGKAGTWAQDLGPVQQYIFDSIAGDLLHELGYASEGWWADSGWHRTIVPMAAGCRSAPRRLRNKLKKLARSVFDSFEHLVE